MPDYYRVNRSKITLSEFWNISPGWKSVLVWILFRLGKQPASGSAFPLIERIGDLSISESELEEGVRARLAPRLEQASELGFHGPRFYRMDTLRRDTSTTFVDLAHESGGYGLRLMHTLASAITPPIESLHAFLISELEDGTQVFTGDQKKTFNGRRDVISNLLPGKSLPDLLAAHQRCLEQQPARNPPKRFASIEEMDAAWNRNEVVSHRFQVKRGLYVKMSPEEVEAELRTLETVRTMKEAGNEHAEVMLELEKLHDRKAGWGSVIAVLLVSMLLFAGAGAREWSLEYLWILIPVLLFHELGHYVAMRLFHYRNLRMFFIPFFGAAVSGENRNVAGWKKVVVSLMGPVPGIVVGAAIGLIGLELDEFLLQRIAVVSLVINAFNLLPVLPLDGGWIVHTLLFSRHLVLDTVFRVVAVVALALAAVSGWGNVFYYLSAVMGMGIAGSYRRSRVVAELRKLGVEPAPKDAQGIPPETAVQIIAEVKKTLAGPHSPKMVATEALSVFEAINARPPGWPATIGLLFVYAASIGFAVVFVLLIRYGA